MIDRRFLVFIAAVLHVVVVSSITDHLIPPPPPPAPAQPAVPAQQLQPADRISPPRTQTYPYRYAGGAQNEPPGFMQRIARWFGFNDDNAREQQLQASQQYAQYKESPRGYQLNGEKASCGLCNKYPWVPMFPGSFQYPLIKHYQVPQGNQIHQVKWTQQQQQQLYQQQQINQQQIQQHQINQLQAQQQQQQQPPQQQQQQQLQQQQKLSPQQLAQLAGYNYPQHQQQLPPYPPLNAAEPKYAPTHFQPPLVQRAVQFNSQPSQDFRPPPPPIRTGNPPPPYVPQPHFAPIPVPNLSPSALPPIYDAQPFRPVQEPQPSLEPVQFQQLPKYEPTVSFQAQPQSTLYEQQQPPRIPDPSSFQQIGENAYTSITENIVASSEIQTAYPTQIPPSGYQDQQQPQQPQPPQQPPTTPGFEIIKSHQVTNFVSEIEYPANFEQSQSIDVNQEQPTTTAAPEIQHPITLTELGSYSPLYTSPTEEPPAITPDDRFLPTDTIIYHNHQEVDNYATDNFPSASSHNLSVQHENHLDIDPIQHSSSENYLPQNEIFLPTIEPTTLQPQFVTDDSQHTTVQIVPSLQTTYSQRLNYKRDRETPKRLLDSPIHYLQGGSSPRPFTKDPAALHIRSSTIIPPLQNHREENLSTPTPWHRTPTPTSNYSSIDASGHFAGMTPPAQQQPPKQYHQIIIPYTTKHKPRPFQPKEHAGRYENWANDFDPHEQQESKLVTATQPTAQPTTKYLTKILASNLRELLKKEHEIKNKSKNSFDLSKLQKNIDDWTEQEFTSLSHRASTVSLRGHSKHIPTEYLTTTPSFREPKTTVFSPNHLEPLLYKDRGTKRYEFNHVENNRIEPQDVPTTTVSPSTTTTTTPEPSTTTTEPPTVTPFYIRAVSTTKVPKENWNKAKVTVSPLTKEKIYVVTPQPTIAPGGVGSFKSPRFIVRPTPASGSTTIRPSLYTPELFGLMGISAYIPAAPVETIDGHSKVITVVTPSNSIKRSEDNEVSSAVASASSNANQSDQSDQSSS